MISRFAAAALLLGTVSLPSYAQSITGRPVPVPIVGVTYDEVQNVSAELTTLQSIPGGAHFMPSVRIVFDTGETPSYYKGPITMFRSASYIMGELIDSSYMTSYSAATALTWTQNYTATLGSLVDVWEVGNEVNGNWLSTESNGADVMPKIEAMYNTVAAKGGRTALTFFYEGEPSDPNNCIATGNGGNDMFTWINERFSLSLPVSQRPAATEAIRTGINYALISWYPDQCPGEMPNWPWVYTMLAEIFPNAQVGFGELGTANPEDGSTVEHNEITSIYPMQAGVGGLPANYISGVFWWYAAEEVVPWPCYLGDTLQTALAHLGVPAPTAASSCASSRRHHGG